MTQSRARAIRRCLRLIDAGATIEHVVGEAYNAGHVDGSDVRRFTDAEADLLQGISMMADGELAAMTARFPVIADLILGVRLAAEKLGEEQRECPKH